MSTRRRRTYDELVDENERLYREREGLVSAEAYQEQQRAIDHHRAKRMEAETRLRKIVTLVDSAGTVLPKYVPLLTAIRAVAQPEVVTEVHEETTLTYRHLRPKS